MAHSRAPAPQSPVLDGFSLSNLPVVYSPYRDEFNPYEEVESLHTRESTTHAENCPTFPSTGRKYQNNQQTKQPLPHTRAQIASYASQTSTLYSAGPNYKPDHMYNADSASDFERSSFHYADIKSQPVSLAKSHPFSQKLEAPEKRKIVAHVILCVIAYPALLGFSALAENKTLFWARFVVGLGCGSTGLLLGWSLLELSRSFLVAATWATLIHQSCTVHAPGMKMRDLAVVAAHDATSAWGGVRLLWRRLMYPGTARRARRTYDTRPWSLIICFFLFVISLSASLTFIIGRIVDITAAVQHQTQRYYEVAVMGDISAADMNDLGTLGNTFSEWSITWRLSASTQVATLPAPLELDWQQTNEKVYFAEVARSQLLPNGSGLGTFAFTNDLMSKDLASDARSLPERSADLSKPLDPGALLRFPRWGIRIHCERLSNPDHIIPQTNETGLTYAFVPKSSMRRLFNHFGKPYPLKLDSLSSFASPTKMAENDTFPSYLDPADFATSGYWWDNKMSHSFKSVPLTMGEEGEGWTTVEIVMVRLNTTYAPHGNFLRQSEQPIVDNTGVETFIGYDAAVCLELYEPYIVEVYNSSIGLPTTTRITSKSKLHTDFDLQTGKEHNIRPSLDQKNLIRELNSTRLREVYDVLHQNSVNHMLKDNGQDAFYVPNPTLLSFTRGEQGPRGYTELDPGALGRARAMADATYALPYFAGSGETVARSFPDEVVSKVRINRIYLVVLLGLVMTVGLISGLCVPKLPLHVPKRGFEFYSWLALLLGKEIVVDQSQDLVIDRNMTIQDIEQRMGDVRFKYVV